MLDIRYRPRRFSDVIGQSGAINILRARVQRGEAFDTSYLFSGYPGTGKTTLARVFALSIFCQNRDPLTQDPCLECDHCKDIQSEGFPGFSERDAASRGSIEEVRGILDDIPYALPGVPCRIVLFDEAHRLSLAAQEALLKSVEEKRIVVFLCTTEAHKINGPIRTRLEEHSIRKPPLDEVSARVKFILDKEAIEYDWPAIEVLVRKCDGLVRETLNRIETLSRAGRITLESVLDSLGLLDLPKYYQCLSLATSAPNEALLALESLLHTAAPSTVSRNIAEILLACYKSSLGVPCHDPCFEENLAPSVLSSLGPSRVLSLAKSFSTTPYESPSSFLTDFFLLTQGVSPTYTSIQPSANLPSVVTKAPVASSDQRSGGFVVGGQYLDTDLERSAMTDYRPPKRSAKAAQSPSTPTSPGVAMGVTSDLKEPLDPQKWREAFFKILPPRNLSWQKTP